MYCQLDGLLKRKVLTEEEFAKANEKTRAEQADLEKRKAELTSKLQQVRATEAMVERVPQAIKAFVEAFLFLRLAS